MLRFGPQMCLVPRPTEPFMPGWWSWWEAGELLTGDLQRRNGFCEGTLQTISAPFQSKVSEKWLLTFRSPTQLSIPAPHCNASPPPPYMWDCDLGNRSQNKPSSLESFLSGKTEGTNTSIKDDGRTNPNPYHSQNEFHFIWDRTLINEHYLKKN